MNHFASSSFWKAYRDLPDGVQRLADSNFAILKQNSRHPSLHFKRIGDYWSVRVGIHYRALGVASDGDVIWFWIGSHADYDKLLATV